MRVVALVSVLGLWACVGSGGAAGGAAAGAAGGRALTLSDPTGDDDGPGTYRYPTDAVYEAGSFDLTKLTVAPSGNEVELTVGVASRIEDRWDSRVWGGNGFSVQMVFVFIDTDHVAGSGVTESLPGLNVSFAPGEAWDKVVIISPQAPTRVSSEISQKAARLADRIIVPQATRASGKNLVAVVSAAQLGGMPQPSWGYQVLMQSNEGFPAKTDLLTRKVDEYEGPHRFGGGTDYDNDPHAVDILVPPAKGGADEKAKQHELLSAYDKDTTEPKAEDLAVVPMVYPGT